jgi:hypothetical protein
MQVNISKPKVLLDPDRGPGSSAKSAVALPLAAWSAINNAVKDTKAGELLILKSEMGRSFIAVRISRLRIQRLRTLKLRNLRLQYQKLRNHIQRAELIRANGLYSSSRSTLIKNEPIAPEEAEKIKDCAVEESKSDVEEKLDVYEEKILVEPGKYDIDLPSDKACEQLVDGGVKRDLTPKEAKEVPGQSTQKGNPSFIYLPNKMR